MTCVTPVIVKQEEVSVKRKLPVSEATELLEVEQKRLKIDESRLLVEQKRLEVEQKRLAIEERRLLIEEQRWTIIIAKETGQSVVLGPVESW